MKINTSHPAIQPVSFCNIDDFQHCALGWRVHTFVHFNRKSNTLNTNRICQNKDSWNCCWNSKSLFLFVCIAFSVSMLAQICGRYLWGINSKCKWRARAMCVCVCVRVYSRNRNIEIVCCVFGSVRFGSVHSCSWNIFLLCACVCVCGYVENVATTSGAK